MWYNNKGENMKDKCLELLNKLSTSFLSNELNEKEDSIIKLLKEIIVVEKETVSGEKIFNQLKENYFESDEQTINFINGLFNYNVDTINLYIDIYLEQAYNNEMNDNDINNKILNINNILLSINPEFVLLLENKLQNINN